MLLKLTSPRLCVHAHACVRVLTVLDFTAYNELFHKDFFQKGTNHFCHFNLLQVCS